MKIKKVYESDDYNKKNILQQIDLYVVVYLYGGIVENIFLFNDEKSAKEYKLNYINHSIQNYNKDEYPTKKDVLDNFSSYYLLDLKDKKLDKIFTFNEELNKPMFINYDEASNWFYEANDDEEELTIINITDHYTNVFIPDIIKINRDTNKYNL